MKKLLLSFAVIALGLTSCKKYSTATLTSVEFNPINQTNLANQNWDDSDEYDLYLQVKDGDGMLLFNSEIDENWNLDNKFYDVNIPLSDPENKDLQILLYDVDEGENDLIYSKTYDLAQEQGNEKIDNFNNGTSCKLNLFWTK